MKYGFLPKLPNAVNRSCYACGANMPLQKWAGKAAVLRCDYWKCRNNYIAQTAHTPMHSTSLTYKQYPLVIINSVEIIRIHT